MVIMCQSYRCEINYTAQKNMFITCMEVNSRCERNLRYRSQSISFSVSERKTTDLRLSRVQHERLHTCNNYNCSYRTQSNYMDN